ncbi:MAG: PilZ domain-containing protein [Elusimicrobia bacterium]|nr:PilZ domain-containing protein [Elusimicrobiota bacterium]
MTRSERRTSARLLTEFPLVLSDETGRLLDDNALAHDLSDKGFRVETQTDLSRGQVLRFRLSLDEHGVAEGRAVVVWSENSELSKWAGVKFQKLSWGDRRRVRRVLRPPSVDWNLIADKALLALVLVAATAAIWKGMTDPVWRRVLPGLVPKAFAAVAAGWALREMLRPGK